MKDKKTTWQEVRDKVLEDTEDIARHKKHILPHQDCECCVNKCES